MTILRETLNKMRESVAIVGALGQDLHESHKTWPEKVSEIVGQMGYDVRIQAGKLFGYLDELEDLTRALESVRTKLELVGDNIAELSGLAANDIIFADDAEALTDALAYHLERAQTILDQLMVTPPAQSTGGTDA